MSAIWIDTYFFFIMCCWTSWTRILLKMFFLSYVLIRDTAFSFFVVFFWFGMMVLKKVIFSLFLVIKKFTILLNLPYPSISCLQCFCMCVFIWKSKDNSGYHSSVYTLHFWGGVGRLGVSYLPSQSSPIRLGRLASRPKGLTVSLPQHEDY